MKRLVTLTPQAGSHIEITKKETLMKCLVTFTLAAGLALSGAAAAQEDPLRIGFVSHQHDITDLFGQLEIGFRDRLDEEGIEFELFQANPSASGRHDEMLNILENMANLNLDYMVFGPSSLHQNTPGLVEVAEAGTKLLLVDYEPAEGEEFPFDDAVLNWSVYNHGQMGELTGEWIAEHFKTHGQEKADIIIIWGPVASEISQDRGNGVLRGMEETEGFTANIVYEGYGDFQRELAYAQVESAMIAYPNVDAIAAMNSVMALGTMSALESHGSLDEVLVTGMGGQPDELEMVARGKIGVAVFRDPRNMGANSAEALIMDLKGRTEDIPKVTYTELRVLDSVESIREYVPKEMLDIDAVLAE
jgi:ABC-type sugar transport system substrate-binding protein